MVDGDADGHVIPPMSAAVPKEIPAATDIVHLLGPELTADVAAALDGYAPRPTEVGLPVLLQPDGIPWDLANAWLRDEFGASDSATRNSYAPTVLAWGAWCWANDADPAAPTREDLLDYRDDLLHEADVSGGTWNRYLSSIASWLRWLDTQDGGQRLPRRMKQLRVPQGGTVVSAVSLDSFRLFRDVGLRGLDLDGIPDPEHPGRTGERDATFANLMVSTGMRRAEAAHLLICELPLQAESKERHLLYLPGPLCKGGKPRYVEMLPSFLRVYRQFLETEWPTIVHTAQGSLRRRRNDLLLVDNVKDGAVRMQGRWRRTDTLRLSDRRRLVATPDVAESLGLSVADTWLVPLSMFPATRGVCPAPTAWTLNFRAARLRTDGLLQARGLEPLPRITPHVLRHTFGVEYLRAAMAAMSDTGSETVLSQDERRLRRHLVNPLTDLRERMGHSQMDTTLQYLAALKESDPLTSTRWSSWADALFESEGEG